MKVKKDMKISVDCGYSSFKAIVNGLVISTKSGNKPIPIGSEIIPIENDKEFIQDKTSDYIGVTYNGRKYLIGDYARKLLLEEEWQNGQDLERSLMESYERFDQTNFIVSLMACVGYSIVKYCEYTHKQTKKGKLSEEYEIKLDELNDVDVCLALALPQAVYENRKEGVVPSLVKMVYRAHDYDIQIGSKTYHLNFKISDDINKILISSQVIAAYSGATTVEPDETGAMIRKPQIDALKTPILIIDGGYKTIGLFRLARGGVIMDAESNTDYSMAVIDKMIEEELEKYGSGHIKAYNIEALCSDENEKVIKIRKDGEYVLYDLIEARERYAVDVCKDFIKYLDKKFRGFRDVKQILVTGGVGAMYYEQLNKYLQTETPVSGPVELAHYTLHGQHITPVYAIVAGLSRQFNAYLDAYAK